MEYVFDREEVRFWALQDTEAIWKKDYATLADVIHKLSGKLLEYMDDRAKNPGVWDGAPNNAIIAKVHFYKADKVYALPNGIPNVYTRKPPKTKAREIAERKAREWQDGFPIDSDPLADLIEAAILEAQKDGEK
jgi:hypothetical protein